MSDITFTELAAAPSTPAAGKWTVYTKSDGVYVVDDAGTEYGPFGSGGGWDGDIADIDLDGGTDIGAALVDADLILVDDGAGGTNRKAAMSRVKTYAQGIKLDDLTAPDDNTDLDASAAKHGLMSKTYASKLDGVEAGADVTDATNVTAAGAVMESDYDAQTILAATTDNTPTARTIGEAQIVGRQTGGNIGGIAQVSAGEKTAGTETALRGFSPDDVKDMIQAHAVDVSVHARLSSVQSVASSTVTTVVWNAEDKDTHGYYNTADGKFTPALAGTYRVTVYANINLATDGKVLKTGITRNGITTIDIGQVRTGAVGNVGCPGSGRVYLDGVDDYIVIFVWHDDATSRDLQTSSWVDIERISSADLVGW